MNALGRGIVDGSLLQRQFSINQIITDCKALTFPEIVAGIVVCRYSDSDFRQADRTKRFNHAAHQNRANASTARVGVDCRVVDARPSSVVAGKNRANAPSAIVLGCETGVGIASWIGDVFGTRRRSTTPMPTPVLIRTRPDRTTRPSGIDRSKNGRDMPRKETNPPHRKGTKNDRTTHRRHGQDGRFHDSDVASDEVTGAIIAIEGPKSLQLSDATAIVGGVQKRLTDKVEIIWGLNFTDEDVLHATVLLATPRK